MGNSLNKPKFLQKQIAAKGIYLIIQLRQQSLYSFTMHNSNTLAVCLALITCLQAASYYCPPGYFFDQQHCETCLANCICSSMNTCSSCIAGYTSYGTSCIQCPQSSGIYGTCSSCCSKTQGTQLSCTDCAQVANSYTFLYSGRCIVSPGCFQINNNGFCQQCFPGFYEWNNICYACAPSCKTCTDSTNCLSCSNGYYWGTINGGLCLACPTGCATCDAANNCYSCLSKYYLFQTNCLNCPSNCSSCTDGSTCTACTSGILVSNLCITCQDITYGGSSGCSVCVASNNFIVCTQCQTTYYLDSNGICQSCATNIAGGLYCRDQNTPTQCQNDYNATLTVRYYLVGITCILNAKSCRKINDIYGNCSSCYSSYTLTAGSCVLCPFTGCVAANASVVNNTCTCTLCNSGYYLNAGSCTACTTLQCATCPSNTCSNCLTGYYLSVGSCLSTVVANCKITATSSTCNTCMTGFYLGSNNLCYACQTNCLICTARFVCTSCADNYFLQATSCVAMPTNCIALATNYTCSLCGYGYYLSNGYCLACKVQLGTLSQCTGLCPIDYYILNLVITSSHQIHLLLLPLVLLLLLL